MEPITALQPSGGKAIFFKASLLLALTAIISAFINLGMHCLDNKFTFNGDVKPALGVFHLTEGDLRKQAYYIADDWEFYLGHVTDFETIEPEAHIKIGQYAGFELNNSQGNPHGTATYRMELLLPEEEHSYMLELSEIFSAYSLLIDGQQIFQSGNPKPDQYEPEIRQTRITFQASGSTELVFHVTNYSHYYSGIVYPPAFGLEQQVSALLSMRTVVKTVQCFFALLMAISYFILFRVNPTDKRRILFGGICFCYLGYASYFLIHTFAVSRTFFWYRLENGMFFLLLFFLAELIGILWGDYRSAKRKRILRTVGLLMILIALVVPPLLGDSLQAMLWYGRIVTFYKIAVIGNLCFYSSRMLLRGLQNAGIISAGLLFFGISLAFDAFHRYYEPVRFGWGAEYAGFVLICIMGVMLLRQSIRLEKRNQELQLSAEKKAKYMEEVVHDLKAPLSTIAAYAELTRSGIAEKAGKQEEFLGEIEEKAKELASRIQQLRKLDYQKREEVTLQPVNSLEYLRSIREKYSLALAQKGLALQIEGDNFIVSLDCMKMDLALENLIINSARFTKPGGTVKLIARLKGGKKQLIVSDTGVGMDAEYLNLIFARGITEESAKDRTEHSGLGLTIVKQIMEAHNGTVEVESQKGEGSSFILTLD